MNFFDFISTLGIFSLTLNQLLMICVGLLLLFLAINKKFEPLLLLPIGFGAILTNIPEIGLSLSPIEKLIYANNLEHINILLEKFVTPNQDLTTLLKDASYIDMIAINNQAQDLGYKPGILFTFYEVAIGSGIAPLLIFMGVGAMTDFGPLLANPKTLILGAAAQFGIFATVMGALALDYFGVIEFTLKQAAATGIIGGADGPTAIYVSSILAPELLGAIAVAAYSYMALVPLIQPPIMKALTTQNERKISMVQLRVVSEQDLSDHKIIAYLVEDNLIYDQVNYYNFDQNSYFYGMGNPIVDFVHNDVLRHSFTDALGNPMQNPTMALTDNFFNYSFEF